MKGNLTMEIYYRMREEAMWEGGEMKIELLRFQVIRHTPKGAFVERNPLGHWRQVKSKPRFILDIPEGYIGCKRFAYPTVEQAKTSFLRRKEVHISRLEDQIVFAKAALNIAKREDFVPDKCFVDETLPPYHCY